MGVIWLANQLDLNRPVVVKVVREELVENAEVVARTLLEARAAAQLRGEHVVRVLDLGQLESGSPYIVMEYLEGNDLFAELSRRGALPVAEAVDLVLQACEGLAEAHVKGLVHRDLKPENLFLATQPDGARTLKLLDFGIAQPIRGSSLDLPRFASTQALIGSPEYMAPEQMRGVDTLDARADIWSLGVILYELLSARSPFRARSVSEICDAVTLRDPLPLGLDRSDLPDGLESVVLRCLEKSPERRYASVMELAYDLARYGGPDAADRAKRTLRTLGSIRPKPLRPAPSVVVAHEPDGAPSAPSTQAGPLLGAARPRGLEPPPSAIRCVSTILAPWAAPDPRRTAPAAATRWPKTLRKRQRQAAAVSG